VAPGAPFVHHPRLTYLFKSFSFFTMDINAHHAGDIGRILKSVQVKVRIKFLLNFDLMIL
jgi:hypothetical protein